ncbi:alkaline phosphatase [Tautonia sociabilis]|uniref:Alkaline phosphatase n=1 Tax=Tautonia sociabilis TaxID=2080755 RepID=A0A432MEB1_9BACT|nr:alkaline phosphatase [Tautonia sociabilis]RUL83656.1 alkaline phosphatase [Tautonia sociabilis]
MPRVSIRRRAAVVLGLAAIIPGSAAPADDPIKVLQAEAIATKDTRADRPYHFGSQGPGDVFSNHASHTNRLVPVITLGRPVDLASITGENSLYRDAERLELTYGRLPANTLNPQAEYGDQSDLYRLQKRAVERGAKHLFVVLFDGMDWPTLEAAAIVKSGDEGVCRAFRVPDLGPEFSGDGTLAVGSVVTSPTHAEGITDVDRQTVSFPPDVLQGGYDPRFAGQNPWDAPELDAPGYLRGQSATPAERERVRQLGGELHAYTDSAASAAEIASGVKSYNDSINVGPDGSFLTPLFHDLQRQGWKVGTVSSVPFNHASPAAMYARNVHRDDYQDLARDMLGLRSIAVDRGAPEVPGLDVVIGTGFGDSQAADAERLRRAQGANAVSGNRYLADADLQAIDSRNGGSYVVALRTEGRNGDEVLAEAARQAVDQGLRLFGFFGTSFGHLPFQTADGAYDPAPGLSGRAEEYSAADIAENPTLAEMTEAALAVLGAEPGRPFALFLEAGDVDWALHDNNLDNAIGAVFSGEAAIRTLISWVEANSSWDESALIITADHGHYLVLDDPSALVPGDR